MFWGGLVGGGDSWVWDRLQTFCFLSRLSGACWRGCKQVDVPTYAGWVAVLLVATVPIIRNDGLTPSFTASTVRPYFDGLYRHTVIAQPWAFARGGRRSKSPENVPFLMQIEFNYITRCFMKFEAKWTTPVVWAEIQFKLWHWIFTYWATTLNPGPLLTSKTTGVLQWSKIAWHAENRIWWNLVFHPFWNPLCGFFQREMGQNMGYLANYCSVSPHFCCNDFLYCNADYSYIIDTNRVSWWWDMTDWWWKVGFTPRAIRHVHPYWQLSSLGVIYIWVLSLETAGWVRILWEHFKSPPLFSPPSTTSVFLLRIFLCSFLVVGYSGDLGGVT